MAAHNRNGRPGGQRPAVTFRCPSEAGRTSVLARLPVPLYKRLEKAAKRASKTAVIVDALHAHLPGSDGLFERLLKQVRRTGKTRSELVTAALEAHFATPATARNGSPDGHRTANALRT